jgi:hypothetical protein
MERNVNRILNSTMDGVKKERPKVDVLADAVERTGAGTRFIPITFGTQKSSARSLNATSIFGCMDTVDQRYLLNAIASYYFDSLFRYLRAPGRDQGFRWRCAHP